MKSKQTGLIAAIVVIMWACNSNQVSGPANFLSLEEHTTTKGKFDLLSFKRNAKETTKSTGINKKKIKSNHSVQSTKLKQEEQPIISSYQDEPPLTLESLYKELDAPVQTFEIDPNINNTITCSHGTEINIPKGSFELKKEEDNAVVSINVKEYYGKSSLLFGNLGTVSNDALIESGGTIYIDAFQNNQSISLKTNKQLHLKFPDKKGEEKDGMELFTGNRDQTNQQINWQQGGFGAFISRNTPNNMYRENANPRKSIEDFTKSLKKNYKLPKDENFKGYKKDIVFKIRIDPKGKLISVTTDSVLRPSVQNAIMPILQQLNKWTIDYNSSWFNKKKNKLKDTITEFITLKFRNKKVRISRDDVYNHMDSKSWSLDLNNELYRGSINNSYIQTNLRDTSSQSTLNYAFSTNKLGWINCDRFLNQNKPLTNVIAKSDDFEHSDFKLVFSDINSIMPGYPNGDEFNFPNIPVGHKATLLAIKINDNKIYVTTKAVIAGNPIGKLNFTEVTKDELKSIIKQLDT